VRVAVLPLGRRASKPVSRAKVLDLRVEGDLAFKNLDFLDQVHLIRAMDIAHRSASQKCAGASQRSLEDASGYGRRLLAPLPSAQFQDAATARTGLGQG
jgi:hypothetical protein